MRLTPSTNVSGDRLDVTIATKHKGHNANPESYLRFVRQLGYQYSGSFVDIVSKLDGQSFDCLIQANPVSQPSVSASRHFVLAFASDNRHRKALARRLGYLSTSFIPAQQWLTRSACPPDMQFFSAVFGEVACPIAAQFHVAFLVCQVSQWCYWIERRGFAIVDSEWQCCTFYKTSDALIKSIISGERSFDEKVDIDTEGINAIKRRFGMIAWH